MLPVDFKPSPEQAAAIAKIFDWLDAYNRRRSYDQVFRLFGYAGTGKTTLIQYLARQLGRNIVYAAYTGKAARVLQRNLGCTATTIHALCYRPLEPDPRLIADLQARIRALEPGSFERLQLEQRLIRLCEVTFEPNAGSLAYLADLIVIDECSMVDAEVGQDLIAFDRPILVLGDPGQLPPIEGRGFFTADPRPPDVMLTQIQRQAAGDPIIQVATLARTGERIPFGRHGASVYKAPKRDVANGRADLADQLDRLTAVEQVVVGYNKTRRWLNRLIRAHRGIGDPKVAWLPTSADKILIRRNYRHLNLLNGDLVTLADISWERDAPTFTAAVVKLKEDGTEEFRLRPKPIYAGRFMDHYDYDEARERMDHQHIQASILADFGYVLTAHTAQGSEWRSVLVVDERLKGTNEDHRRWLYTALTRAKKLLFILG